MINEIGFSDKQATARAMAESINALTVSSSIEYEVAGNKVNAIRELEKELEEEYKEHPIIVQAKTIQRAKGELAELLEAARKSAKGKMIAWEDAQERKRRAEEACLQEVARKKAEQETIEAAVEAEAEGNAEKAAAILEAPVAVPTVVLKTEVTNIKGHSRRTINKFRFKDCDAIRREYMMPDQVKIGQVVRALGKPAEQTVGGIEVYSESV